VAVSALASEPNEDSIFVSSRHGSIRVTTGRPIPLGLSEVCDGFNLAVFSRHATQVTLLLFKTADTQPVQSVVLKAEKHRTGDVWHVRLTGELADLNYMLKVDGPWAPGEGHRFDPKVRLLDPYATTLVGSTDWDAEPAKSAVTERENDAFGARCVFPADDFDWQGDRPPRHRWRDTVIYETHVRGLTIDPSSNVDSPGQYLGLLEKIPYFQELGITTIELMPVQEFRGWETRGVGEAPVRNYWGYDPVALFAPKASYASASAIRSASAEFKTMVRELHKANIEVVLDVVFNHTAEHDGTGPTISFRGLDNSIYYLLAEDKSRYIDFTGCGNTLNCNHPVVRSLVVDCLRHWVVEMHVDGFRFDLASILGRDTKGQLLPNPPLLEQIAEDPVLRRVKLIAEAWDLGGSFQLGHFPGQRWAQWNCHFRDDVRRFWRGDAGTTGAFATRLCGSADLFQSAQETPVNSINFITSHDGFTLNDLVSYARKHNESNGENNRDGMDENYSENNGVEGASDTAQIESVRLRQIKNMLVSLFVSRGVPMLLGGDEFRRSQRGNNNAYCQDNEISWYDWALEKANADLVRFVGGLIGFRREYKVLAAERFYDPAEIEWFGVGGAAPDWQGSKNQIGCLIKELSDGEYLPLLCLLFNAAHQSGSFVLPSSARGEWGLAVDTSRPAPADLPQIGARPVALGNEITLGARTTVVLVRQRAP